MRTVPIFSLLTSLLLGVIASPDAYARDYYRSCSGALKVTNSEYNLVTLYVKPFTATASAGWYIPNTIRLRAYRRARSCFDNLSDLFAGLDWDRSLCEESNGIRGMYPGMGLYNAIVQACARHWPWWVRDATVNIYGTVWGGKGCGGDRRSTSVAWYPIERNYRVRCIR
jgi:hypothetical protein